MNSFMSDFLGEYIVCLMEYGELPSLGVQDNDLKKHEGGSGSKKCDFTKYAGNVNFPGGGSAFAGGSGSGSGGGGNNGRNGSSGKGANASQGSGADKTSNQNSEESSNGGKSGGGRGSLARPRGSPAYARGQITRSSDRHSTADSAQDLNDGKVKVIEDKSGDKKQSLGESDRESSLGRSRRGQYGDRKYKAISGTMADEIEKTSKTSQRKPSSTVLATSEDGYRFMPLKRTFTPPETAKIKEEKIDEGFSFGNFLKWLIIAGIAIAAFILFGGQVMNYSNSDS